MLNKIVSVFLVLTIFSACSYESKLDINIDSLASILGETTIIELELKKTFEEIIGDVTEVGITKFNVSVSSDGYINTLNISFVKGKGTDELTYVYRRNENVSNSYKTTVDGGKKHYSNLKVLEIYDENIKQVNTVLKKDELIICELLDPTEISITADVGDIIDGVESDETKEVIGLAFHSYKSPLVDDGFSILNITTLQ